MKTRSWPFLLLLTLLELFLSFQEVHCFQCQFIRNPSLSIINNGSRQKIYIRHPACPESKLKLKSTALSLHSLPTNSHSFPLPLVITAGLSTAGLQWFLGRIVFRHPRNPKILRDTADYTAHSVVALSLMILLSSAGVKQWWLKPSPHVNDAFSRLVHPSPTGRWMAAVVLGGFAFWDIPVSLRVQSLRKPDVIAHHCVMMILAAMGSTILPMHYIIYYFGVVELSSIPLILYDQVSHWIEAYQRNKKKEGSEEYEGQPYPQIKLQQSLGIVTAIAFTAIRVISFTKVTLRNFLPDVMTLISNNSPFIISSTQKWAMQLILLASGGFTLLQWYWFSTIVRASRDGAD